jgi:hypothetical protein
VSASSIGLSSFSRDVAKIASGIGLERIIERSIAGIVGGLKQPFAVDFVAH